MIPKYRNRGIFQVTCAALLSGGFIAVLIVLRRSYHPHGGWIVLAIALYLAAYIMWTKAGFSFVRAKGYSRDHAGSMFLFLMILGFCVPIVVFALPAVALFGLDDRSGKKKR